MCDRDIKPANLLINPATSFLKVADFGTAIGACANGYKLESYIVTRWYRAPELLLGNCIYDSAVDCWSAGCVIFEMLTTEVLFEGQNSSDQLSKVVGYMGTASDLSFIQSGANQLSSLTQQHKKSWRDIVKQKSGSRGPSWMSRASAVDEHASEVLDSLLQWTPANRTSAHVAIACPYFVSVGSQMQKLHAGHLNLFQEIWMSLQLTNC